jgi:hypothetical protein
MRARSVDSGADSRDLIGFSLASFAFIAAAAVRKV